MTGLLDQIKSADIEGLTKIAGDVRTRIIDVVSKNGGHLAPSLGVVELTVALHHVFNSPVDGIIWDVGHQSYAHKIITGRDEVFSGLRTRTGLAGFPKRNESPHDVFGTGHCSTSVSAALGIAEAKRMTGKKGKTLAVMGDGALTAGLAYEGLNHAGHIKNKNLIVVFNDNQMSIDKNVGAIARFMNRGLTHPMYNRLKRDLKILLKLVSTEDLRLVELSRRAAVVVKDFFMAGSLFEAFGFRYIGPIDGHDMETLVETLKNVSSNVDLDIEKSRPVLLHVITKKGKGYEPAEKDPSKFHGTNPFNIEDGKALASKRAGVPTWTSVFGKTVCDLIAGDSRVVVITAAMPSGTGLDGAKEQFPNRYYDVGIAEPHAVVLAAGLATQGLRPIVAIYSSFLQRAYDEIIHDVCLQKLPVIFALDRSGVVGEDGPTHHGVFDLSYLRHIPNIVVASPADEDELVSFLHSAIGYNCPVAIRYPRGEAVGVTIREKPEDIRLGEAKIVLGDEKAEVAIVGIGNMVEVAKGAASILKENGIVAAVINARFVKPLDDKLLCHFAALGRTIVTVEDNALAGGFGSAVMEMFNNNGLSNIPVIRCGYPDAFVEHATIAELHDSYGLTPEKVARKVEKHVSVIKDKAADSVPTHLSTYALKHLNT